MWMETKYNTNYEHHTTSSISSLRGEVAADANRLRHSVSFSYLPINNPKIDEKNVYRARTATISTSDLEYGFVTNTSNERSHIEDIVVQHDSILDSAKNAEVFTSVKSTTDKPSLLKTVLVRKSANLLHPNLWWSSKFRLVKSMNKTNGNEKSLQKGQTFRKRWRSLSALFKTTSFNAPHSLDMPQSSLPTPQSFYLLDDFLKPSSASVDKHINNSVTCKIDGKSQYRKNNSFGSLDSSYSKSGSMTTKFIPISSGNNSNQCIMCKQFPQKCKKNTFMTSTSSNQLIKGDNFDRLNDIEQSSSQVKMKKEFFEAAPVLINENAYKVHCTEVMSHLDGCNKGSSSNKASSTRREYEPTGNSKSEPILVLKQNNYNPSSRSRVLSCQTSIQPALPFKKSSECISRSCIIQSPFLIPNENINSTTSIKHQTTSDSIKPNINDSVTSIKNPMAATYGLRSAPIKPSEALNEYNDCLTEYEKKEIVGYKEIWFVGASAYMSKIKADDKLGINYGYDDENGNYNKVINDHLHYRYQVVDVLGKGSFGQVIKAYDHKTGIFVAIKIIRNKKRFNQQAQVELIILNHLRRKDINGSHNVIHMLDYFYFRKHLCITFELLHSNLYEAIKRNGYHGFDLHLVQKYAFSMIQCLKLLYREKIIHCDLKPENILLQKNNSNQIKVIDFGSSCYTYKKVYTYIQSRFYRSPEIILGLPYDRAIDMWSFGCILAELHTGYPLFPGENEVEQLACIMEVIGLPPYELLLRATRKKLFFDTKGAPRCLTNSKQRKRKPGSKNLANALKTNNPVFVDFISRCLQWNPEKRMTADEALKHHWLREYSTPPSDSSDENCSNSVQIDESKFYLPPL